MTAAVLLALGLGILSAGVLLGRYYVPDDRSLRRSARHAEAYAKTINLLLERDRDAAVEQLVAVVAENVEDVEPYFALGALFRNRGEWERAIRVHQAIELRGQEDSQVRQRARYQLGLDFRAAGMPRRATRAMEDCLQHSPGDLPALRSICGLYEEQGQFAAAAQTWQKLIALDDSDDINRVHHLYCAGAQQAIQEEQLPLARRLLESAKQVGQSAHLLVALAEVEAAAGDWQQASKRLREALALQPELVGFLAEPLRAAEMEVYEQTHHEDQAGQGATLGAIAALESVEAELGDAPILALASAEMRQEIDAATALDDLSRLALDHPKLLSARVAAARLALQSGDAEQVTRELEALVGEDGLLDSSLDNTWRCQVCGHATEYFFWRCDSCRTWGSGQRDASIRVREVQTTLRERRLVRRSATSSDSLPRQRLGAGQVKAQPQEQDSSLGRAGKWISGAIGSVRGSQRDSDDLDSD